MQFLQFVYLQNLQDLFCHSTVYTRLKNIHHQIRGDHCENFQHGRRIIIYQNLTYTSRISRRKYYILCVTVLGRNDIKYNKQEQEISNFHIKPTKYDLYIHQSYDLQVREPHNSTRGINTSQYNRSVSNKIYTMFIILNRQLYT